ncbi:MAG: RNA methyltransferase [Flavobacteriaceae bacterium]|nr:RNA methyltransferase [Flavobacteriaceae bacterium]
MLTAALAKYIKSLQDKKFRQLEGHFVVEGDKSVGELLRSKLRVSHLLGLKDWLDAHEAELPQTANVVPMKPRDLERISGLTTPQAIIAIAEIPIYNEPPNAEGRTNITNLPSSFTLYLDGIRDPGNLGTIIRTADWYGLTQLFCSPDTVDCYSPKVVQACMGSLFRMQVHYVPFETILSQHPERIFGAVLDGLHIGKADLRSDSVLVIGNEASGIRPELLPHITQPISIPKFGEAESLNAAVATGILLDRFLG